MENEIGRRNESTAAATPNNKRKDVMVEEQDNPYKRLYALPSIVSTLQQGAPPTRMSARCKEPGEGAPIWQVVKVNLEETMQVEAKELGQYYC
eukprot:6566580-Ditylum_brightwellii.AAC.1